MKITEEQIERARTANGGWDREALEGWGVPWPPPKGWKNALLSSAGATLSKPQCGACQYFDDLPNCFGGLCRRRAPMASFTSDRREYPGGDYLAPVWPQVSPLEWCGDFEEVV